MSTTTHENAIRGAIRIAKAASNGIPSNHPRIAAAEGALTELLASHKALVSALESIADTDYNSVKVARSIAREALAQAEKVAK